MASRPCDVIVVGAGIVGLAIAFRLVTSGKRVLVLDRASPGSQASSGNAGHIATEQIFPLASPSTLLRLPQLAVGRNAPFSILPGYWLQAMPWLLRFVRASTPSAFASGTAALTSLQRLAMEATARLLHAADATDLLHQRGHFIVAERASTRKQLVHQKALLDRHHIPAQWVTPSELASRVPELTGRVSAVLHVTGSGHVSNPLHVCQRLQKAITTAGGTFVSMDVQRIKQQGGLFSVGGDANTVSGKGLVIAAGAWSAPLAAQLGVRVPLDTERGYHATARNWAPEMDVSIASLDRTAIVTPMNCGVRITGFVELGGLNLPATQTKILRLQQHLRELFPRLPEPEFSDWLGFRPSLPDFLPAIGPLPPCPNAYAAFGHQHLGLTLAAVTADIITDLVHARQPGVDLAPFRPDRFHQSL